MGIKRTALNMLNKRLGNDNYKNKEEIKRLIENVKALKDNELNDFEVNYEKYSTKNKYEGIKSYFDKKDYEKLKYEHIDIDEKKEIKQDLLKEDIKENINKIVFNYISDNDKEKKDTNIRIDSNLYKDLRNYCKKNNINTRKLIEDIITDIITGTIIINKVKK